MQKFNIGGVIGLADGTHISILRPAKEVEFVYFAVRKSCHTKNVQIVSQTYSYAHIVNYFYYYYLIGMRL